MKRIIASTLFFLVALSTSSAQTQSPLVKWVSFQEALEQSPDTEKKVLVDIFAPWCGWCTKMQNEAYMDKQILEYLESNFVSARLDISVQDDTLYYNDLALPSAHLAAGFGAEGTPTTVFLTEQGEYITRLPGYAKPEEFLTVLKFIATDSYRTATFAEFSESVK